jgi:tetratricopeptide (TPR) repeat protein
LSKYWAFISYSHRDSQWAAWLHRALESYHPPKPLVGTETPVGIVPRKLSPIFRDREELASSTALGEALNAALAESACQVVICSPAAARSRWVNEEILAFKRLGREHRIFCFIVDGEPNASDIPGEEDQECFPPALRYRLDAAGNLGSERTEPIAADARAGKDGRANAKLKLIAGILGVGFDALRQRELHRRQRRLFAFASGAVAGMVITSGLAAAALIARAQAQRQTAIARREAETARQTTAFLVDLFRISDPSEARGNALTAREVLDKGAARVGSQLKDQPQIRATLMDTLGTVYMGLGLYSDARPLLESAADARRVLNPPEPAALAASLSDVGDLLTFQADYPGAERAYHEAIALQEALPRQQRDEAALAKALFGLGNELQSQGNNAAAEDTLRQALALQERLFTGPNEDTARTLQVLAWAVRERSLNQSVPLMERAVAMQRALWGAQSYPDYAAAVNDLGLLYGAQGDYARSEPLLRESLAMLHRLLGDKHSELSFALENLAQVQEGKGDFDDAEVTFHQALAMQRELLGEVHPAVANTLNNLAYLLADKGDVRAALATERESLDIYRKVFPNDNADVARVMNRVGYWYTRTGDYAAAEEELQAALAMRQRLFAKDHPEIGSSLMHLAVLQVATHDYKDALRSAQSATTIFSTAVSPDNWKTAFSESVSGAALAGLGQYAQAEQHLVRGYAVLNTDAALAGSAGTLRTYRSLARSYLEELYVRWGRPQDAVRYAAASYHTASTEAPVAR